MSELGQVIAGFPKYLFDYLFGFVVGILCDVTLSSLAIGSVAVGWVTQWQLGVALFFFGHFWIRTTNARGQAVVRSGREVAGGLHRLVSLFPTPEPPAQIGLAAGVQKTFDAERTPSEDEAPNT